MARRVETLEAIRSRGRGPMHALIEFVAEIAVRLLPEAIQRNVPPKNQLWVTLGCTLGMLTIVALVVVYFATR